MQGTSLLPAARGERLDLLALSETWYPRYHYGWSELTAVRDGRYKFIAAPRRELYDLQNDPGEQTNLAAVQPAACRRARARARRDDGEDRRGREAAGAAARSTRTWKSGCARWATSASSVSPRTLDDRPRGDPKDKIGLYNLLKLAGTDSVAGRLDDAVAKVRKVLQEDAEVVEAYVMLGNLHTKARRTRRGDRRLPDARSRSTIATRMRRSPSRWPTSRPSASTPPRRASSASCR